MSTTALAKQTVSWCIKNTTHKKQHKLQREKLVRRTLKIDNLIFQEGKNVKKTPRIIVKKIWTTVALWTAWGQQQTTEPQTVTRE